MQRPRKTAAEIAEPVSPPEYIEGGRVCNILGVDYPTVERMARSGLFRWRDCEESPRKQLQVHYKSLVEFCDRLREQYRIADRRPPLSAPCLIYRDEDLLPFPLADTISEEEACAALGYTNASRIRALIELVEGGYFESYQLMQPAPWRVSSSSLFAFVEQARRGKSAKLFGLTPPVSH